MVFLTSSGVQKLFLPNDFVSYETNDSLKEQGWENKVDEEFSPNQVLQPFVK